MKIFNRSDYLAEYLGVSQATIVQWRKRGMPHRETGLCRYRYDLDKVLTWLARRSPKHRRFVESILKREAQQREVS